jgi:RNA polymerase sigma-70 factor (ECF subfamily)
MTAEMTDGEIARLVQRGDIQSFAVLVDRYENKMKRYAKKFLFGYEDAEDLVQEVFLKAYANIQSFDPQRPFGAWLYRIAHNEFINAIKKKGREPLPFFDPDTLFPHPLSKDLPEQELKDAEVKNELEKTLKLLDPKYREPLVLFFIEDLDYKSISEIMRIPVATVGVRISRGKLAVKKAYQKLYGKPQL